MRLRVDYDLRKYEPHSAYPKCEFSVPVGKNGDTHDRYWIRVQEMYESVKIIRQCLEQIQDGPVMADVPAASPCLRKSGCSRTWNP